MLETDSYGLILTYFAKDILYICSLFFFKTYIFFLHGQHPIAFVAHLYIFKCWRRSSSNSTHAGSHASLCERLCRTVEI